MGKKEVEHRIKKLKQQLCKAQKDYHMKIFKLLNSIFSERLKENHNYTLMDLSKESIICDMYDYHYITAIMAIRKITSQTKKRIEKGAFTVWEVANSLRRSKILQEPKKQNAFFKDAEKRILNNDMTKKDLREGVTLINSGLKKDKSEEQDWFIQTVYEVRSVTKNIFDRYNKLSNIHKVKIDREVKRLYDFISGKLNKEYSLVPIKKSTLNDLRLLKIKGIGGEDNSFKIDRLVQYHLTRDIVKCKNCTKKFKKSRSDQEHCSVKCKHQYNNKKATGRKRKKGKK